MSLQYERAIPGQSLIESPKNAAFERPPDIADPVEALEAHLDMLEKPGAVEDTLHFLEIGVDLQTLVQGMLRNAVVEGVHSIDVSLIIAPVLHEYIKGFADNAGIDYDEGLDDTEEEEVLNYRRDAVRADKMFKELKEININMPKEEPAEEIIPEENMLPTEEEEGIIGLMARTE